jgi:hypothetical protein
MQQVCMRRKKHARVLVRKHEVRTLVDSPACRWEDTELVLKEQGRLL